MDDKSYNIRVSKRGTRLALTVLVTALIVAPLTAVASHQFTDVPDSHTFHADIGWLADAGITLGCNPPANDQYCPSDDVNRGQMAAFMKRFNDYITTQLGTVAAADIDSGYLGTTVTTVTEINSVSITASVDGVLLINGSAFLNSSGDYSLNGIGIKPFLDGTAIGAHGVLDSMTATDDDSDALNHYGYTTAVAVSAGTYTVSQSIGAQDSAGDLVDASLFYNANNLTVLFVPGGSVSAAGLSSSNASSVLGN